MSRTLNLGIVAHVDAGKTSLTERLLHAAGVIDEIGSVDAGSTQTDTLALERRRGITIKSAVVSFAVDDLTVNLIDTPGHPDFIAEVERVLGVLDGAVLVVSAVEGVQPQTRVLMRTLRRLRIPTLIFVNKIDRRGADVDAALEAIAAKLTPAVVPMGSVRGIGGPGAAFVAQPRIDVLADHDDGLLAAYVDGSLSRQRVRDALAAQTARSLVHPVYFGSAITGAGVAELVSGIRDLLPPAGGSPDRPVDGTVFKVDRGPAGEKVAYVRLFDGTLSVRERYTGEKVTAISVFDAGSAVRSDTLVAGRIGKLWGLGGVRVGDRIGGSRTQERRHFAPPSLATVVDPVRAADRAALHVALSRLAEQDPLINLRQDERRREVSVSLYGEVQKEVIQATLAEEYGLDVTFRETTTICVERPSGVGEAVELKDTAPFLATVGLRVTPGSGVTFDLGVELGSMPLAFFKAVEETVHETLREGPHGWQVVDCAVTMTRAGYYARQSHAHGGFDKSMSSTAGDFRLLTPLVLMAALRAAGTTVLEPVHRFHLEAPADTFAGLLPVLSALDAVPVHASSSSLDGDIPAARVHALEQRLPGVTRGEGMLESAFDRFEPVRGAVPSRPRTDHNPMDRKEYLIHVVRRV